MKNLSIYWFVSVIPVLKPTTLVSPKLAGWTSVDEDQQSIGRSWLSIGQAIVILFIIIIIIIIIIIKIYSAKGHLSVP